MRKFVVLSLLVAALTFVFAGTASADYPYRGGARFNFGSGVGVSFYNGRAHVQVGNYPYRNYPRYYSNHQHYYHQHYRPQVRQFYVPPVSVYRPDPAYSPAYTQRYVPSYPIGTDPRIEMLLRNQQDQLNQQQYELRRQKTELDALKRDQKRVEQKVDWHDQLLREIMKGP